MKTIRTKQNFPTHQRIFIYVAAVAAFCFLNCLVLQAQGSEIDYPYEDMGYFSFTNMPQPEASLMVKPWMLDFQTQDNPGVTQPGNTHEHEVNEQLHESICEVSPESDLNLDSWMVETETWDQPIFLADE